ncbi:MAG TPA: arylesterase [Pseudomonadales bacterium]|nr:arylesterase [Pseudomonadales bacterium]MDP6317129.1 arylesterase [Pseudomonadales bacterium]MDP7314882.1 arylesterase [Pseudomonadales bacterium]MDP7576965.1 arylesterase [Pseudomonadales bacterium]HJL61914.1 arylesterase [Pseudomonadales bacterium]
MLTQITLCMGLLCFVLPATAKESTILVFGDSVSAAYGMDPEQGWVHLLTKQLQKTCESDYQVINASVSGETTGGGLIRLPKSLEIHQPDVLILELGGNDGLRGYPIGKIENNLIAMTRMAQAAGARVLLIGMVLPPNYGKRYTTAFETIFSRVAGELGISFLPYLLQGVATPESLLQGDGIHPKAEAQAMLLDDIWPHLAVLLNDPSA